MSWCYVGDNYRFTLDTLQGQYCFNELLQGNSLALLD